MGLNVVLVFELTADIHWMKDVVQLPVALAKHTGGVAHAIVRPNHKQNEVKKHIKLHYQGKELNDNFYCFENSDFSKVVANRFWHNKACIKASKIGGILILYPFFGNPYIGAFLFKINRWVQFKKAFVILKSDGTLNSLISKKASLAKKNIDYLKYFFIDEIICENESVHSKLKTYQYHLFLKTILIPNCPLDIYHSKVNIPYENRPNIFLFVGRISDKEKGADILLEAWIKINKEIPNWKLQMIGPCSLDFKEEWSEKLLNMQASTSVIWIQNSKPSDLLKYYNNSKIVVCSSRKESGPIILSEAALSGCAFIGTSVGEIPIILEGLPGLIQETSELARTMLTFANNSTLAKQQAKDIFLRMKDRNWYTQVEKIKIPN